MRSRKYDIKLRKVNKTIRVIVYADRSVEMGTIDHNAADSYHRRAEHLQTREEAAFFLTFDRHDYNVKREYI